MSISHEVQSASKWSLLTEILSKLMSPIVNMILARLIAPDAFGMVASITMVTSFADIFTDAGFQKFLIQKSSTNQNDLDDDSNVAFWTNLSISVFLWINIFIFKDILATFIGNVGLGSALAIAALSLPLTSFSSIQIARYRRCFDFKTLFFAKLIGIFIPIFVTIPLAFTLKSYWAIIIGTISVNLANAILLTLKSTWKPRAYFSFFRLREMLNFSLWTLSEQLLGWANLNIGVFVVGAFLSDYYLGLFKTSMAITNQILLIIVNAFAPVLFSALSRLKDNKTEFYELYYLFIRRLSFIIVPLGLGIFVFSDLFTLILLGPQWSEASPFIGLWGMLRSINIVFGYFSMEVFVSIGKPKYSVFTQFIQLLVLVPALILSSENGYESVYLTRCAVVIFTIIIETTLLHVIARISTIRIFKDTFWYFISAIVMGQLGFVLQTINSSIIWGLISVFICIIFYVFSMFLFTPTRKTVKELVKIACFS